MFRIHFQACLGAFIIQVMLFGAFWVSVRDNKKVKTFTTFKEAQEHVAEIGLDHLYEDRSINKYREYINQGQVPPGYARAR